MITNRFSPEHPVSCVQGRHGELIVVQGNGVRPVRSDLAGPGVDAGMDAPTEKPSITVNSTPRYYIARTDVYKPGICYYAPPVVTFSSSKGIDTAYGRQAKATSFLNQSSLAEIRMDDGGKYYRDQPTVELSNTFGSGAVITAALGGIAGNAAGGDPYTGITEWKIVQAPPYLDAAGTDDYKTWYYAGGSAELAARSGTAIFPFWFGKPRGGLWNGLIACSTNAAPEQTQGFSYSVSGGSGSGATLKVTFGQPAWVCSVAGQRNYTIYRGARELISVEPVNYGSGYKENETVVVRIPSGSGNADRDIILHGITSGNQENTKADSGYVQSLTVTNGGSGYLVAPVIKFKSNSGFGAYATCKVKDGKIISVDLEAGGAGYKTPPVVEIVSGGAEAFAVARPHLRGKYQCYYRYIDDTPEDRGGPIPSNLSPVLEVDAGEGAQSMAWVVPQPKGRATKLELWRTTSNQATTLYRVATMAVTGAAGEPPPNVPGNPPEPPPGPLPPPPSQLVIVEQPSMRYSVAGVYAKITVSAPPGVTPVFTWQGRNIESQQAPYTPSRPCLTGWETISASSTHSPYDYGDGQRHLLLVRWERMNVQPLLGTYQYYRCVVSATGHTAVTSDETTHPFYATLSARTCIGS